MYWLYTSGSVCDFILTAGRATGVCGAVWSELWSPARSCWDPARIQRCHRQTPAPSATHYTHIKPAWESHWHADEAPEQRIKQRQSLTQKTWSRISRVMIYSSKDLYRLNGHWPLYSSRNKQTKKKTRSNAKFGWQQFYKWCHVRKKLL